jgi:large subunit ribosomal protein L6
VKGAAVSIEGPRGKLNHTLPAGIEASLEGKEILVKKTVETRQHKALHGLSRALLANFVQGAHQGFQKKLEIQGVGFKAAMQGKSLNLSLGFSHPILYAVPDDIKVTVTDNVNILIEGPDKQKVGAVAADIRAYYPPEPYKGKGVRYAGEQIIRKEGKTAQSK